MTVRTLIHTLFIFLLGAGLLATGPLAAQERSAIAFSKPEADPSLRPPEWSEKPIRHDVQYGDVDLAVALDQQQYPAMVGLIQDFARQKGVKIAVSKGTCGISSGLLARRAVDMAGYCCPPGSNDRLPGLKFHTLGISAIALLVHPDNPVPGVDVDEARKLFSGQVYEWRELETISEGSSVLAVGRLHCKLRPGHWRLLLENEDQFSPSLLEVGSIPDMIAQVAASPLAIGYETLWMVHHHRDRGKVRVLPIDGLMPDDKAAVAEARYPLYRTYSVTTWADGPAANPLANELVEYLTTAMNKLDDVYGMIPADTLRANGWKFKDAELIGEPDKP